MGAYREAIEGLNIRDMAKNFWRYEPPTPEEIETLALCRSVYHTFYHTYIDITTFIDFVQYTKRSILSYAIAGVTFTSFISRTLKGKMDECPHRTPFRLTVYNRNVFGWGMRAFGLATGILGGGIYGIISSTEFTLRKLEGLGPDYSLGRMAINEIEDFRMDKKKNFNRV